MREKEFYATLIEYIEYDEDTKSINKEELLSLLKECEITFNPTGAFGTKSYFCKEYVELRSPIPLKGRLNNFKDYLYKVCAEIYTPEGDYEFWGIDILPLKKKFVARDEEVVKSETTTIEQKDIIYDNFKLKALKSSYDDIERAYIIEACETAINGNRLSATTMIGCAAERLLILLSEAYLEYLKNNSTSQPEIDNFERKVVKADKAHKRLDELYKYISNKGKLFEELGFENHTLHFSFLDVVRQVRNDAGHPTGIVIEKDKLQNIFANYDLLYDKIHEVIKKLPKEITA
ncbi:hypothetical protein [Clostridium thailandense]|uniref:hypothetical protein n=1 Tax=Clostridium thailandense TaxID=2794346 RepID=UPI0039895DD5